MGKKKNRQVNDRPYQHHRIRTFDKRQEFVSQQRQHDYHNPGPKFIRIGDVFIMNDNEYEKGSGVVPDTKVIRFTRPVIVLSICDDLATVIPLTTKNASFNSYPVKISPDKMSYALLSQITTVDISRLDHRVGYLRKDVFNELREEYAALIMPEKKTEASIVIERKVPFKNLMDIIRFENWTFYSRLDENFRNEAYLFIKIEREFIAIPVLSKDPKYSPFSNPKCLKLTEGVNIDVTCGQVALDKLNFVGDEFYLTTSEWYPIAVESKDDIRERISKILGAMYGIYPKTDAKFHKEFVDLTDSVLALSGYEKYVQTMMMLSRDIYLESFVNDVEPKADDEGIVWKMLHDDLGEDMKEHQDIVNNWLIDRFISTYKIFSCDIKILEKLSIIATETFDRFALSFLDDIVPYIGSGSENNIVEIQHYLTDMITRNNGEIQFNEENRIWLANYINQKMESIRSTNDKQKSN